MYDKKLFNKIRALKLKHQIDSTPRYLSQNGQKDFVDGYNEAIEKVCTLLIQIENDKQKGKS